MGRVTSPQSVLQPTSSSSSSSMQASASTSRIVVLQKATMYPHDQHEPYSPRQLQSRTSRSTSTGITWNPVPHIQQEWSKVRTVYGKIALVLFYFFLWMTIFGATVSVLFPAKTLHCASNAQLRGDGANINNNNEELLLPLIRGANILMVGFLLYAEVNGLEVKNVAMVAVVLTAYCLAFVPYEFLQTTTAATVNSSSCNASIRQFWITPVWLMVTFLFTVLEDELGDRGTIEETTTLIV